MKKKWQILPNLYNALISHKYPVALIHFVTQRCNARCPHCFVDFKTAENELSLESIEKIASTTGSCLRNISLTGGEPFIREDIFEIADIWYSNTSINSIVLTTNGSFPERIEEFCKKASTKDLPVSFFFSYDFIEEEHSKYRGIKDLHTRLTESCKIIKSYEKKFNTTFQITITPDNCENAFKTYEYMRDDLNIQNINCTLFRGEKADTLNQDIRNKIIQTYKNIQIQKNKDFENGKIKGFRGDFLTANLINAKNKILWKYVAKTFEEKKYISPCTAGSLAGVIYHDGSIHPCEMLNKEIANIKDFDYNFLKCWHSLNAQKIKNEIITSKCNCTHECFWLLNIFSSPQYYGEISYHLIKNLMR